MLFLLLHLFLTDNNQDSNYLCSTIFSRAIYADLGSDYYGDHVGHDRRDASLPVPNDRIRSILRNRKRQTETDSYTIFKGFLQVLVPSGYSAGLG